MAIYQVIPGTVTQYDGSVVTLTFNQLVALYNVSAADCVLGPVAGYQEVKYIKLKPRADGIYNDINYEVELGESIKYGRDFDGKKKWIQETDINALYSERNNEQQL